MESTGSGPALAAAYTAMRKFLKFGGGVSCVLNAESFLRSSTVLRNTPRGLGRKLRLNALREASITKMS